MEAAVRLRAGVKQPEGDIDSLNLLQMIAAGEGAGQEEFFAVVLFQRRDSSLFVQLERDHIVRLHGAAKLSGHDGIVAAVGTTGGSGGGVADQFRAAGGTAVRFHSFAVRTPILLKSGGIPSRFFSELTGFPFCFRLLKSSLCFLLLSSIERLDLGYVIGRSAVFTLQLSGLTYEVERAGASGTFVFGNLCWHKQFPPWPAPCGRARMGLYSAVLFLRQIIVGSQTVRRREGQAAARNRKIIHDRISKIAIPCNRHLAAVDGIGALVIKEVALAGEAAFPVKLPCHGAIWQNRKLNDYDGVRHDFTRKKGLVWQDVFLPEFAPPEWKDRGVLWNAVEENEKTKDSRLAREFVPALPIELTPAQWQELLTDFIQNSFVAEGMCADVAIHDPHPPGHNPHAHIMLTVRPLDEQGNWQYKTEKEYLCVRNGEEQGFTAAEFNAAQADGWEKQYPYKVGRKKVYMPPSEAEKHGYERANKHPKSTKFGRQNPIAERWNSEEQLVEWRKSWADVTNRYLERYGHDERIDHRSHADRGLTEQPTIHEGVVARALEKKGIISDRCEINRQIKADNALLRELKATIKKLMQAVKNTVPAIAEAMEKIRSSILIFSYQLRHIGVGKHNMGKRVKAVKPELERYVGLVQQIKDKSKERKALLAEKKERPFYQIPKLHDLTRCITELTEELEELKTEKAMLLRSLDCADDVGISAVKKEIAALESALQKLSEQEEKYSAELDEALKQYAELKEQAAGMDAVELMDARLAVREEQERSVASRVKSAYGEKYDPMMMQDSKRDVANLLNEETEARSIRERLRQKQQAQQKQNKKKSRDRWER